MIQQNNGRVDTVYGQNYNIYNLFQQDQKPSKNFNDEAIKSIHNNNDISKVFFSMDNINALQDAIRFQVFEKSCNKHIIDRQSDTELKVIMRAVYLEHAQHGVRSIIQEVKRLNSLVLEFCIPRIMQEINIYMRYKSDIGQLPIPLERGQFSSSKGTKYLETKEF